LVATDKFCAWKKYFGKGWTTAMQAYIDKIWLKLIKNVNYVSKNKAGNNDSKKRTLQVM
jgi:hypothetical protein